MRAANTRRDGDDYVLNGNKTFITNGPYADTIVFICKLDDGRPPEDRKVLSFVLDGDTGLVQSQAAQEDGLHASPTGELFLEDVRVPRIACSARPRTPRRGARAPRTPSPERTGVAAMALGIVERCLELSHEYAKTRVQFGRPIGEFQLIQLKLAKMEVARMNIQNLVFRQIELAGWGRSMDARRGVGVQALLRAGAMEVALEAVQLFGGNGYMAEYQVEQLCRDAKVLQIYGGTDEIQISQIARSLLAAAHGVRPAGPGRTRRSLRCAAGRRRPP
jgi:alkylation response protein AidB-like acyl-CoA dehydrogenase